MNIIFRISLFAFMAGLLAISCSDSDNNANNSQLCGNDSINGNEACDGINFNGQTCSDFGFESGPLTCSDDCMVIYTVGCIDASNNTNNSNNTTNNSNNTIPDETDIHINEVVADPAGDETDWVELANVGSVAIDISGWILRDDDDAHEYIFPADTIIGAGEYFLVQQDDTGEAGFSFGLGKSGDAVRLFHETTLIDQAMWDEEAGEGMSIARLPDGTGDFQVDETPTPGIANE